MKLNSAWLSVALVFLVVATAPAPLLAAKLQPVDVELVLLADASGSIDDAEILFQRQGYARALTHRDVLAAISKGGYGRIALTFIEWGDKYNQKIVVPWRIIRDLKSAQAFAKLLLSKPRMAYGRNAIGAALAAAQKQIDTNEFDGHRKVIDFSGDSANNWNGVSISDARRSVLSRGTIINGLAILCRADDCSGRPVDYNLEEAFKTRIIGGPGSFVVTADSARSFAEAVRRKLVLELASRSLSHPRHIHR